MNEAEVLFTELLKCGRLSLYLNKNLYLDKNNSGLAASVLKRRIAGEPIDYILGKTEFMGLQFKVTADVFVPRPETEVLVEVVLKYAKEYSLPGSLGNMLNDNLEILDLCAGSGCIAVSLAKVLPGANITAIDISEAALKIARQNAVLNDVKINFLRGDLFAAYKLRTKSYELIVSNPPYIATMEIKKLQPEINYEPPIALDGGGDGLDFYKKIIKESPCYLKENGFLIMEMGFKQCQEIKNIFQKSSRFEIIEIIRDYNKIDRVIVARLA